MNYFHIKYEDKEKILTPELISDFRKQLEPQIKEISFIGLIQTVNACGVSPKNMIAFAKKIREGMKE